MKTDELIDYIFQELLSGSDDLSFLPEDPGDVIGYEGPGVYCWAAEADDEGQIEIELVHKCPKFSEFFNDFHAAKKLEGYDMSLWQVVKALRSNLD